MLRTNAAGGRTTPATPERIMLKQRPVYLDLVRIRLPLPGIISILHRISGALLFVAGIPLLLAGLAASLESADSYAQLKAAFAHPVAKLALIAFLWAYLHHFFAGIRFLLLDLLTGIDLPSARRSSAAVLAVSLALTLIAGARLW